MRDITPEIIFEAVAQQVGITPVDLSSRKTHKSTSEIGRGKQYAAYLLKFFTDISLQDISKRLGFKDRQYARYCVKKVMLSLSNHAEALIIAQIECQIFSTMKAKICEPQPPVYEIPQRKSTWLR